jgi:ribosomal protein L11 methyltransferase
LAKSERLPVFCIEVCVADATAGEWAAAEAWEAGAIGVEERERPSGGTVLLLYAAADREQAVREAVAGVGGARVTRSERAADTDWSQEWRAGLEAVRVGERLVVRPSWVDAPLSPGQVEVVVDPGQAFGTGGHVSTRLALEWIEALAGEGALGSATRVLDVGTGTGVLGLAALALGAGSAVGFDLDPLSGASAREWAARNGFSRRLALFVGPIDAIAGAEFDFVFANLLKRELLPLATALAAATRAGGRAVFSGLLAGERDAVHAALTRAGFGSARTRTAADANGDEWVSLLMRRGA